MIKEYIILNKNNKKKELELGAQLSELNFCLGIIGKPGCGKTSVIEEMLLNKDLLCEKFDYVFLFSPTPFTNLNCTLDLNWFNTYEKEKLFEIIKELNSFEITKECNVLFIFDDFISSIRKNRNDEVFLKFIFNRRHLLKNDACISIIVTSQRYMVFPINLRTVFTAILTFKLTDKDYNILKEDCLGIITKEFLHKYLKLDYDFLYININNNYICKNFLEKIQI